MTNQSGVSAASVCVVGQSVVSARLHDRNSSFPPQSWFRRLVRVQRAVSCAASLILLGAFSVLGQAQTLAPGWNLQSPTTQPPVRYIHAMAYDSGNGQVMMFGGFGENGFLNDTWLWNGSNWTQTTPANSPPVRGAHAMVYDAAHGQVVMFGGLNATSQRLGDTWLWDGTNWTQANPASSPSMRDAAVMVYDAAHSQVMMFGGSGGQSDTALGDTWIWDGSNWTQLTPANSPTARSDYSMVYDAAHGQVVLFGGEDITGAYLNDTWTWDGTTWTQQNPANSPPARYTQGMAYDAALGETVMFGGENSGVYLNDTWIWDGTNWTQGTTPANLFARSVPNGMAYDAADSQVVLFGGLDEGTSTNEIFNDTWNWGLPANFGNINVCPSAQTTPAPCSNTLVLTYNFAAATTLGTPQVVTQGATGLDFSLATGNTCTGSILAGGFCTVSVTFTPQVPGLRSGAVELLDSGGNLLATTPVYGVGQGPAAAFAPGTPSAVGSGWNQTEGVAVDAAGDVFVSNYGLGQVVEVAPGGAQTTVPATGLSNPYGVAVDGAGDVFIADPRNARVVKVTPGGVQTTVGSVSYPYGVAVDGAGDVFIVDSGTTKVVEVTPGGVQTTVPATGLTNPYDVAVDGAGDVFISEPTNVKVVKVTPGGVQTTVPASGLACPYGVAVDAAGDVFIADPCVGEVVQVAPNGVQTTIASGLNGPISVAVDGTGDVFIGNDAVAGSVTEVNRSQVPTLQFDTTYVGFTSDDSPQSIQLENIGNQTLSAISPGLVAGGSSFLHESGSGTPADCTSTFSLAPGSECNLSISFRPTSQGTFAAASVFTDNALNANPAQQVVYTYGSGINPPVSFTLTGSGTGSGFVLSSPTGINCNVIAGATSGACVASFTGGSTISLEEVPNAGSTFAGWTGACASSGTSQFCNVTLSAASSASATFILTPTTYALTVAGAGSGTGLVTSNPTGISCNLNNGAGSGTCSSSYAAASSVTLTAAASGTSEFAGWSGACASAGTSPTCSVAMNAAENVTATFVNQSFGNVNVCPAGQTTPAPCSGTLTLTVNIPTATTVGVVSVVTQGASGLDFSLGSGGTCTGSLAAGSSCTVNVSFAPLVPGLRRGAVNLYDNNGNLITSTPVYGVGQGPAIAFGPGTQTTVSASGLQKPSNVALDGSGDIYISDYTNNQVVKVSAAGVQSTVPATGLNYPRGLAVDGAGDLFIADNQNARVVEISAAGVQSTVPITGLSSPYGVAVDGAGNLFVADAGLSSVVKLTPSGIQTTVGSGLGGPFGLAVDGAGDVFIADTYGNQVVEVTAGGAQTVLPTVGVSAPEGVWVDAAGDVFIADYIGNNRIVELPAGVGPQTTVFTGNGPEGVTTDGAGDIFIADTFAGKVVEIIGFEPLPLGFALTNVGSTSADSPQAITVQNVGNQTLTGTLALTLGTGFAAGSGSTCGTGFSLAPGASCNESFSFKPLSTGLFTGTVSFSDNNFNLSPLVSLQTVNLSGNGGLNGQPVGATVPNVVGQTQAAATSTITTAGLTTGTVGTAYSSSEPAGTVVGENPAAGSQVNLGTAVSLLISTGQAPPLTPNPLTFENNYFVTGDYASAGVTLRGTGVNGMATGTIVIPDSNANPGAGQGVPDGADIVDGFLYWTTLENTATPSAASGTFLGYPITGQQVGNDLPYTDGTLSGTLRVYRADVNAYFPVTTNGNGVRYASGSFKITLPDSGGSGFPLTEGASLVVIYRVLSPNFPLKSIVIYDGSAIPASSTTQAVQGFYDALGGTNSAENTILSYGGGSWNNALSAVTLTAHASQYSQALNAGTPYAAVILSTPVTNSDNDGILDAWKSGPGAGSFFAGQSGYTDVKTQSWVALPGAKHGEKDLFVQLDYMCGAVLSTGACDPTQENLFPAPDPSGNDPLAMVQQAFAAAGIVLHLNIGNIVPESTCTDGSQLCQFPNEPGVIGWKNSLEFSKAWPRNYASCVAGGDCTARFPYGQKDSYHYVLFGHSLAIPAWNTRYGTITSIQVVNQVTTIVTADRGTGINACPSRITLSGVQGNPSLNGVYNTSSCPDTKTIIVATPGVSNWSYPNTTLPEPVIGLTSGTVTSISGYSDLGGSDSAVTLALWETAPNQDMSKRANVVAGTLFHEIGHTLGLSHGGLYYDTPGSYVPNFEANCKPNFQSVMNYLFQLDGVGPNAAVAYSNQTLTTLYESSLQSVTQLTDTDLGFVGSPATFSTSSWYTSVPPNTTASAATLHCDGTPLTGDTGYRVTGTVAPISPAWQNGQNIGFDGVSYTQMRGYNDVANTDLRQVGATGGEFTALASVLSFGSSEAPLSVGAGGNVTLGSGGTVTLASGGNVTLSSGGNVTLGSGGTVTLASGGSVTLNNGGNVTLGSGGTVTLASGGNVTLSSGGNVTLSSGGNITLASGGSVTLASGGNVTLSSGGTVTLASGGSVTIPSTGGSYTIDSSGGTVTLASGGNVTLSSGGNVTLSSGGTVTLASGGNVTLSSGGNVTLSSGGNVTLSSGGTVTLASGGNVTLGSGGTVTLGSGGASTPTGGGGGNVTLGSGGNVTLGSGGTVTLGSGGNVTLSSGGNVTLSSGGNVTLTSGGNVTLTSGGTVTLASGGTVTPAGGSPIPIGAGDSYTFLSGGGNVTLSSGGNVTLSSGGNVTLSSGGNVTLTSGGNVTLTSGGNVTLGSGGVVSLGSGGNVTLGSGGNVTLSSGGNITLGSGGATTTELTYDTANSVVRPPTSPTETPTPQGVRVDWTAPAFGVVSTYTIYRSSNGATPIVIGSVSGVNGFAPVTEFIDTNPDLTSQTVTYTISTTIVPDPNGTQRQSAPSVPAVLKNDQTITLGPLPSSVTLDNPPTVTATAMSGGNPNGLQVVFSAAGSCSIGSQSIASNVSSAAVVLNTTGSCTITASQPGTSAYNAANSVSGTFMVLPQNSGIQSQTINFAPLQNMQYGNSAFSLSASSSANQPVSFTASGPCTTNGISGTISGAGVCSITASAAGSSTYSAASLTQSFTIFPAALQVTANNLTSVYGQSVPTLTYSYSGFVNGESTSVLSGAPALSTTATQASSPGTYPITVSTGTLAAANYSFRYGNGTLTIQPASQSALTLIYTSPLTYNQSETLSVTGGSTRGTVTYSATGPCTVSGARLTASSGTGACIVTATMAGNSNYNSVSSAANTITLAPASQVITFSTNPPASAAYNSSFTVAATGGGSGNAVNFTSAGACSNAGATYTMTNSTGTCSVIANQAGNSNYAAAATVTKTVNATGPSVSVSPSSINFGTMYLGSIATKTITVTNTGTAPVTVTDPILSIVKGGNSNEFVAVNLCLTPLAAGKSCTVTIAFVAGPFYTPQTATLNIMDNAPGSPQQVALSASVIDPLVAFNPTSLSFGTIKHATSSTLIVTVSNPGGTPLIFSGAGISITGTNPTAFTQSNACGSSLAAGAKCTVTVKFTPPTTGTFSANLTLLDNSQTGSGTQTVPLSGKGN